MFLLRYRTFNSIYLKNYDIKYLSRFLSEEIDSKIKIYSSVSKKKELLKIEYDGVTWYTCGPTVYDSAHLGHASCYVKLDIIQRILRRNFGYNLLTVMNITDIDDKIISSSKEKRISPSQLAQFYEKEFWQDMDSLNVIKPKTILRVTEHVDIILAFIENLEQKTLAYKSNDGSVYFDVNKFGKYGKFKSLDAVYDSHIDVERNNANKKHPTDFALWKAAKEGEPAWNSRYGRGRPGWHIECSALATLAFGSKIDIHAGGIDLRFPHHENEEAQSCAFHSKETWVNNWLHTGHLHLKDSEKMSKSLKNTISIQKLLQDTSASTFRMACFMSHYRSNMEYSQGFMSTADTLLKTYRNFLSSCRDYQERRLSATVNPSDIENLLVTTSEDIQSAFCDDFDTPRVVKHLGEFISKMNTILHSSPSADRIELLPIMQASNFVENVLETVGIDLFDNKSISKEGDINYEMISSLVGFRQDIRQIGLVNKNKELLELCDRVRDDLRKNGITIKDQGKKSSWSF